MAPRRLPELQSGLRPQKVSVSLGRILENVSCVHITENLSKTSPPPLTKIRKPSSCCRAEVCWYHCTLKQKALWSRTYQVISVIDEAIKAFNSGYIKPTGTYIDGLESQEISPMLIRNLRFCSVYYRYRSHVLEQVIAQLCWRKPPKWEYIRADT
jgi:hypothetical protein